DFRAGAALAHPCWRAFRFRTRGCSPTLIWCRDSIHLAAGRRRHFHRRNFRNCDRPDRIGENRNARSNSDSAIFLGAGRPVANAGALAARCLERTAPDQRRIHSHPRSAAGCWRDFSFLLETIAVEPFCASSSARYLHAWYWLGERRSASIDYDRFFRTPEAVLSFSISAR